MADQPSGSDKAQKDLRILQQIESTIEGTLLFIVRFFRTAFFLALHPRKMSRLLENEESGNLYSSPFTFLAITTIFFSPLVRYSYRVVIEIIESITSALVGGLSVLQSSSPNYKEKYTDSFISPEIILQELPEYSIDSVLKVTLPTILIIIGIGALLGSLAQAFKVSKRKALIQMICYVVGFQFIIFSITVIAFIGSDWFINEFNPGPSPFSGNLLIILIFCLFAVIVIWPTIGMYSFFKKSPHKPLFIRLGRNILLIFSALAISVAVLAGSCLAPIAPLLFEERPARTTTVYIWSVKSIEIRDNVLSADLLMHSHTKSFLFSHRNAELKITEEDGLSYKATRITRLPADVKAWSDLGQPLLELNPGDRKWIQLETKLNDSLNDLLKSARMGTYTLTFQLQDLMHGEPVQVRGYWKPYSN